MRTARKHSHSSSGFTLVEVSVAALVLALGLNFSFTAINWAQTQSADADRASAATELAQTVRSALMTSATAGCPGTGLLADLDGGGAATLSCIGGDASSGFDCDPDHPVDASELNWVLGTSVAGGTDQLVVVPDSGSTPADLEVRYRGTAYRVVWNVACDVPVTGNRAVELVVGWDGGDSIANNRFVRVSFSKANGI